MVDETLRRYRAAGGSDSELVERWLTTVTRGRLRMHERATVAAWCEARLSRALGAVDPEHLLVNVGLRHGTERIAALADALRLGARTWGTDSVDTEAMVRTVLLALPLAATAHRGESLPTADELATSARRAVETWWRLADRGGAPPVLDPIALAALAALAAA